MPIGEELEQMSVKQLGRLKAQGADVGDLMARKKKEMKTKTKGMTGHGTPVPDGFAGAIVVGDDADA